MPRVPLRLVFAGTPNFALPCLQACHNSAARLLGVYSQPDRASGRGRRRQPGPVKHWAQALGVAVEQPSSLREATVQQRLREFAPDLLVVVAYGLILPPEVLAIPKYGCWNVHASLLPRWRGAAPIQRAILAGDQHTGTCLMQMEAGLDTGPVLLCNSTAIDTEETAGSLHDRLAELAAAVLTEGLSALLRGESLVPQAQSTAGVSYARKLQKSEARLDWNRSAEELARQVRAFNPWPVCEAVIAAERLRIWRAVAVPAVVTELPGQILAANAQGLDVSTASGVLRLLEVQRAGGRPLAVGDFLNARPELRHQ